jgi:hypothetical protein
MNNPLCKELKSQYTPIKQINKWTILVNNDNRFSLCITDSFYTFWGIVYDDKSLGYDYPERIPEKVKKYIREDYIKLL